MAEQSPDPWRVLWQRATSNEVLIALLLALAASVTLTAWIPQRPSSDADYARWFSRMQSSFGEATSAMRTLGLFSITSSVGFRGLLALLSGCVVLRAVEGADRLVRDRDVHEPDGGWRQTSFGELGGLLTRLRSRRYRVVKTSSFSQVDLWPWSAALPLVALLGVLILLGSMLLSHVLGWRAEGLVLQRGERQSLLGGENWVSLSDDGSRTRHGPGVVAFIEESGPGVQVSAVDKDGESLEILLTPDAEPSSELSVALTGDTYFAIPEAELVVRLTPRSEEPYARADVYVYSSPQGEIVSEEVTDEGGSAVFAVKDVVLTFRPAPYARVTVTHNPGRLSAGLGLVTLVMGLLGSLSWSGRRFWLREEDAIVEVAGLLPSWLRPDERDC